MTTLYPLFVLAFFLTILESNSQTSSTSTSHDFIIRKQQDTVKVLFIFPTAEATPLGDTVWMQNRIIVVANDETVEFLPEDLQGFCYNGSYYESICLVKDTTTNPWTTVRQFCKRILNGRIQVYASNSVGNDEEGYHRVITDLYYKMEDQFPEARTLIMNNTISKLISDCPPLSHKIKLNGLNSKDRLAFIRKYNSLLEPKTSH